MAKQKDINYGIPEQNAPDAFKATKTYGNQVANYILNEWFYGNGGGSRYYDSREEFTRLRLYARGQQNTAKYKRELAVDGDLSFLNLDWEPVPIIPKFVDLVVNKKQDRVFDVTAKAMDTVSTEKKKRDFEELELEMKNKEQLLAMQEATGVNMFENDPASLPESQAELDIYMSLNYKQLAEIAAETTVEYVFESNNYHNLKRRLTRDIVEVGMACAKHDFDPQKGVVVKYVDPAELIYSYTEDPDFSDTYYFGEVKRVTVADMVQMFPKMTPSQVQRARSASAGHFDTFGIDYDQVQEEGNETREANKVELLFFSWKATHRDIHKIRTNKKGGLKAIKRDETFEGPKTKEAEFEKTERVEEVVYQGVKVIGDDSLLLKWELQKNMVRSKSSELNAHMPFVVSAPNYYKGIQDSLVKRITKYADMIQLTYLKIQQVIQRTVPPGLYIDMDGLAELDMGDGSFYSAKEAINMFFQTGSIVGRSLTVDGDGNRGAVPIQELPGSQGTQLQSLIGAQQYYLEQIRAVTGINEAIDATSPDPKTLVGVQDQQIINSNTATRHILDGILSMTKRMADAVVLRMQDVFHYHPLADNFKRAVGRTNALVIEELGDLHLKDFGIFIDLEPDEQQKNFLEQNIQQALQQGLINIDDAIDVRQIKNLKLANQVLKLARKKKAEDDSARQQQEFQAQSQAQAQGAMQIKQAEAEMMQMKSQIEMKQRQFETQMKTQELAAEMEFEKEILMLKQQLQKELLSMEQSNENMMADKNNQATHKREELKNSPSNTGGIGIASKSNTIDHQIKGKGLLG